MQQLLNTLYLTSPKTYVRLEGTTLCVEIDGEKTIQVPLHHLCSVVCVGDVMLTPAAMYQCADAGRSLIFLDRNGRFRARLEGPTSGNVLLRLAQFQASAETRVQLARSFVAGKLRNSRHILMRHLRDNDDETERECLSRSCDLLAASLRKIPECSELDELRGIEGDATRNYFRCFTFMIRKEKRELFNFRERSRRPPLDRINALISFLYALVLNGESGCELKLLLSARQNARRRSCLIHLRERMRIETSEKATDLKECVESHSSARA